VALSPTSGESRLDNHGCKKSKLDDPWLNCTPTIALKDYMKVECVLATVGKILVSRTRFRFPHKLFQFVG